MEQPEESDDGEVDDSLVDGTFNWVLSVKGGVEPMDDGHIGGVGSGGWVILVMEALEKSRQ